LLEWCLYEIWSLSLTSPKLLSLKNRYDSMQTVLKSLSFDSDIGDENIIRNIIILSALLLNNNHKEIVIIFCDNSFGSSCLVVWSYFADLVTQSTP
jgi:hypothetical protein